MLLWFAHILCAVLAVVVYRLCTHHPARWRHPSRVAVLAVLGVFAAALLLTTQMTAGVAAAVVVTAMMFWLGLLPLLESAWRHHRCVGKKGHDHGA